MGRNNSPGEINSTNSSAPEPILPTKSTKQKVPTKRYIPSTKIIIFSLLFVIFACYMTYKVTRKTFLLPSTDY